MEGDVEQVIRIEGAVSVGWFQRVTGIRFAKMVPTIDLSIVWGLEVAKAYLGIQNPKGKS